MPGSSKVRGVGGVSELLVVTASPDCHHAHVQVSVGRLFVALFPDGDLFFSISPTPAVTQRP